MQRIEAGPRSVAIWLSGEPIPDRHAIPGLVQKILSRRGFAPWPEVEAECYAGGAETLILARPGLPRPLGFYFADWETLLAAALSCPEGESSLYRLKDGYLLTAPRENVPLPLYEHSDGVPLSPLWETHGKEQDICLMEGTALGDLKRFVSTSGI